MLNSIGYAIPSLQGHMSDAAYVPKGSTVLKLLCILENFFLLEIEHFRWIRDLLEWYMTLSNSLLLDVDELIFSKLQTGIVPEPEVFSLN